MSDLFGCVPPEAFSIFTGRHALAAEAALLRLCTTHFGEMAMEYPEREQVKNSIAAAIEGLPAPPDTGEGDEPEMASFKISKSVLTLRAKVPNLDEAGFARIAGKAEKNCPVSKVLNAAITLDAKLA